MSLVIRDDRQMKALTGLSQAQFDQFLPVFESTYQATHQQAYEEGVASGTRQRKPGGGCKGKLPMIADKLMFVLYYYKTYPTFDVLGAQFNMARSKANENLHKLSPILYDTLVELEVMPYRELATPEELKAALQGAEHLLIDATERAYHRPTEDAKQRDHYSGKKKQHTLKNTVMSLPDKFILFLGRTFSGRHHDYSMLKHEFPPEFDWFEEIHVGVDLGYQGIQSDYKGDQIDVPTKKPRKSKKNPNPELTPEQKAWNKVLSQARIFIEHAIGGMKRYTIVVHRFRNHKTHFEDDAIGICAGLWNFVLCY